MFAADAPLLFNMTPSWHKYSWVAEFMAAMRNYEANTVRSAEIGILARKNLFDWLRPRASTSIMRSVAFCTSTRPTRPPSMRVA